MNPLLTGVCAFALGNLATAGTEASSDWLGLDEELNAIASNVNLQGGGVELGALVRAAYISASGDDFGGFGTAPREDQLGLVLDDVELWSQGQLGDYEWRVSVDFGDSMSPYFIGNLNGGTTSADDAGLANTTGTDSLEDAFARWNFSENFNLQIGHFVFPTTFSSAVNPDSLLLMGRSTAGEFFHDYNLGVMLAGDYEQLQWWLAVLNGVDSTDDDHDLRARVVYHLGSGRNATEGALGANEELNASFGLTFKDEGDLADGSIIAFDVVGSVGGFSLGAEFVTFDDGFTDAPVANSPNNGAFSSATGLAYAAADGPSIWAVTLGYLLSENWEIAGRYEDLDDLAESTLMSIGVNYYQMGHNAKWQLMFMDLSSDVAANEGSLIGIGVTVGSNG